MEKDLKEILHWRKIFVKIKLVLVLSLVFGIGLFTFLFQFRGSQDAQLATDKQVLKETNEDDWDKIENGIHVRTGLIDAEGLMTVVSNCTSCHSAKLITQNRMTAARWNETIKWMQETQGLWDLGGNQEIIVNYLVTNYPSIKKGRRMKLENIEWYELEN